MIKHYMQNHNVKVSRLQKMRREEDRELSIRLQATLSLLKRRTKLFLLSLTLALGIIFTNLVEALVSGCADTCESVCQSTRSWLRSLIPTISRQTGDSSKNTCTDFYRNCEGNQSEVASLPSDLKPSGNHLSNIQAFGSSNFRSAEHHIFIYSLHNLLQRNGSRPLGRVSSDQKTNTMPSVAQESSLSGLDGLEWHLTWLNMQQSQSKRRFQ